MKNNKLVWVGFGVLVLVLVAVGMSFSKNDDMVVTEGNTIQNGNELPPKSDQISEEKSSNLKNDNTAIKPVSLSYADALVKYKDKRLQFSTSSGICAVSKPNSVTYKDNTGIMLDNRSGETLSIKVGDTHTIKPYGFKIVVLPDIYLKSKTLLVDCGKQQNVATILIQE